MKQTVQHSYPVDPTKRSSSAELAANPNVTEPFNAGCATPRLLFDFGVMASLIKPTARDYPVLDFGAGIGWVTEFCARMGLQAVAFDIHNDLMACLESGVEANGTYFSPIRLKSPA